MYLSMTCNFILFKTAGFNGLDRGFLHNVDTPSLQ